MVSGQIQDPQVHHVLEEPRLDEVDLVGLKVQVMESSVVGQRFLRQVVDLVVRQVQHVDVVRKVEGGSSEVQVTTEGIRLDLEGQTRRL